LCYSVNSFGGVWRKILEKVEHKYGMYGEDIYD
jgi:hypothetical protein